MAVGALRRAEQYLAGRRQSNAGAARGEASVRITEDAARVREQQRRRLTSQAVHRPRLPFGFDDDTTTRRRDDRTARRVG